ncbi:hypothetical protein EDC37_10635 [Pectinatus cerevisiiphilus]|uniref:Uncharacterized protein n=1 Tax=Pectinatus cerevisiiphilus TaxID=86956 RepID=A0A4R3K9G5_9FIRM|nr:hypothetical protein EDC37_10635 [Pectinatus cerevisiiphilus]
MGEFFIMKNFKEFMEKNKEVWLVKLPYEKTIRNKAI